MKAIQIVVDEELLARVDRTARKLRTSRSATMRRLMQLGLEREAVESLARAEAKAYARKPTSQEERAAFRALAKSQARVAGELSRKERW
jgi:metal-responsive CopG/Arc/MetJ family transcriptional regulator